MGMSKVENPHLPPYMTFAIGSMKDTISVLPCYGLSPGESKMVNHFCYHVFIVDATPS